MKETAAILVDVGRESHDEDVEAVYWVGRGKLSVVAWEYILRQKRYTVAALLVFAREVVQSLAMHKLKLL